MSGMQNTTAVKSYEVYYKWLVSLAAGFTFTFIGIIVWQSWVYNRDFNAFITTGMKISESSSLIGLLDESLTMSARMAAATGDQQWEVRYRLLEPQLDNAIQTVKQQAPDIADTKSAQKTDEANQVLVEMEHRAFELIRKGRKEAAWSILFSPAYEDAKRIYATGLQQIRDGLTKRSRVLLDAAHDRLGNALIFIGILLPLLLMLWALVIRAAQKNAAYRIAAENALRDSEERLQQIISNTHAGYFFINREGRYQRVNDAWLRMHGYDSPDEVIGHPFALTQVDVDQKAAGKIVETMLAGGKSTSGEFSRHCRDGSTRNHSFSTHPVVTAGEIVGLEGFIIDTTDRKQAEDEIKLKNEELKKANLEKDKFFSIIAHDLRSPFQGFLGLTQEMADELPRLTKDEMHEIAVGMRDSATNLFRLLENLLEWARIQQGAIPFNPDVVKLHPVVDESAATALQAAKNKGIDVTCQIPKDIAIFADTNMLQTIIRNLVSNAVKFTPQGGRVSISAKNTGDKSVEISIRDSGIGMSKAIVDNLFRLDVRTNRKGTNGELSTGLGLLLCKEFIEKHGGRIWVESEEGKGSAFYFTIPCNTVTGKENVIKNIDPAVAEDNQIKQLKILIAEDDEKSELLIAIAVKKFARELLRVKNGMDAIEVCRNNSDLDLVLMDIEMPEINGYEATRQIRHFNQNVVIIAQTAYALAGEREKVIAAGCNDYIAKPYNKTTLTALLKKYF